MRFCGRVACAGWLAVLMSIGVAGGQDRYRVPLVEDWHKPGSVPIGESAEPAAWEEPALFTSELRSAFRPLRSARGN